MKLYAHLDGLSGSWKFAVLGERDSLKEQVIVVRVNGENIGTTTIRLFQVENHRALQILEVVQQADDLGASTNGCITQSHRGSKP